MSAVYHSQNNANRRLIDNCPTATILWAATRVISDTHWRWDDDENCYQTHRWTRDSRIKDARSWPAVNALSSLLRALREDDRISGDPVIRLLGLYIAVEYLTYLVQSSTPRE